MSTLTPNLGLILEPTLTPTAKKNLLRLDSLGSTFLTDSQQNTIIRSRSNILLLPNEASAGGSGTGGSVQFGTANQPLTTLTFYANTVSMGTGVALLDSATNGTGKLTLKYNSTLNGPLDATDRELTIDVEEGNRVLRLSDSLHILGGEVRLTGPANVTLPASGQLVNQNSPETLSNKTLDILRISAGSNSYSIAAPSLASPISLTLPQTPGTPGQYLTKSSGNELTWSDPIGAGNELTTTWTNAQGPSLTIVHGFNSYGIQVEILDNGNNYATIEVENVLRPNLNTVQLVSNLAPPSSWTVLLKEIA